MSVKALDYVFQHSQASGAAYTVHICLADWSDQNGRCYPSYAQIARKARVSRATVGDALQELVRLGEIVRETRAQSPTRDDYEAGRNVRVQRRNVYRLTLVRRKQVDQPDDHLPKSEVDHSDDHLKVGSTTTGLPTPDSIDKSRKVDQPDDHLSGSGSPIQPREVGQSGYSPHTPLDPSVDPSVLKAGGAAPDRPDSGPTDDVGVITRIVHEVIDLAGDPGDSDLDELVKARIASLNRGHDERSKIQYGGDVVRRAIASARWQRARRRESA